MSAKFEKIKRPRLYEEIAGILREAILSGRYQPGETIQTEAGLTEQFGVSRNVVREALRLLQSRGFLEIRRGPQGGAFVTDLQPTTISENLSDLIRVGYVTIDHLTHARMYMEPEVFRLAAQNATVEELVGIENLLNEYNGTDDNDKQVTLNCDFHRLVGKACGNPLFSILIQSIMDFTERFVRTINPMHNIVHHQDEHRELFNTIRNHDPDRAFTLAQNHIAHLNNEMKRLEQTYEDLLKRGTG
jgi:DNA-binding FadR family transcriptional regulator